VAAHLAGYKVPARIFIRQDALPRNPAGKLLKGDLKRECLLAPAGLRRTPRGARLSPLGR
jgi:long-chain acyl-CoA synthetase